MSIRFAWERSGLGATTGAYLSEEESFLLLAVRETGSHVLDR